MGAAKSQMLRDSEVSQLALEVSAEAGVIEECYAHEGIFIDQYNGEAQKRAYAIGTQRWKRGEVPGSRKDFMDAIKASFSAAGVECPICAKHMDE